MANSVKAADIVTEALTEEIDALKAENEALKAAKKGKNTEGVTFKHKGKTYEVVCPKFSHNGENVTAEDVVKSEKLQAELIELNSLVREVK